MMPTYNGRFQTDIIYFEDLQSNHRAPYLAKSKQALIIFYH